MELPLAKDFVLVAGKGGLARTVEHVNLLDYEYDTRIPSGEETDGLFDQRSIVVTSMLFAKDRPDTILQVVKQLYVDGVSSIAVIQAYYKVLPQEVIAFADEKSLPIFLVSSEKYFSENVVIGLTRAIESSEDLDHMEEKINFILQHKVSKATRVATAQELIPKFSAPYRFFYIVSKHQPSAYRFQHQYLSLKSKKMEGLECLPYQFGILVCAMDMDMDVDMAMERLNQIGIHKNEYVIGVSTGSHEKEEVANEIREAIYAQRFAAKEGTSLCKFEEMGIWQMILPNTDNIWMQKYCMGILKKLQDADRESDSEICPTLEAYVKQHCDMKQTAEAMSVHENTVRYRIKKAREILRAEENDMEFQQAVWLAFTYKDGLETYFDSF